MKKDMKKSPMGKASNSNMMGKKDGQPNANKISPMKVKDNSKPVKKK